VATLLVAAAWVLSSVAGEGAARVSAPRWGVATADKIDATLALHTGATTNFDVPLATTTSTTAVTAPVKAPPTPVAVAPVVAPAAAPVVAPAAAPAVAPAAAPAVAPAAAPAVAPAVTEPTVSELVVEVEAAGIEPGPNWSWSMGDTATHCGAITGAGTGCTYGSDGLEYTVFSGSPTLALVAHELANAETQNDAVPNLMSEVAAAAGGTAWSTTDAVASCLVVHFMGFQDDSAGTWQCPGGLATAVAANIHDSL
jgi:hypothetical protein